MSQRTKATLYPTLALIAAAGAIILLTWVLPTQGDSLADTVLQSPAMDSGGGLWGWIRAAIVSQLDPVLAWLATLLLGLSGIGSLLARYLPRIKRLTGLLTGLLNLIHELLAAVEDGKVTSDEVAEIRTSIASILAELNRGTLSSNELPGRIQKELGL